MRNTWSLSFIWAGLSFSSLLLLSSSWSICPQGTNSSCSACSPPLISVSPVGLGHLLLIPLRINTGELCKASCWPVFRHRGFQRLVSEASEGCKDFCWTLRSFEQALGDDEGQGSLACGSPWDCKESDMTELLDNSSRSWDGVIFSEYKRREESSFWEKMELASLGNSRDAVSLQTPDWFVVRTLSWKIAFKVFAEKLKM